MEEVIKALKTNNFFILRIYQVPNMSRREVAEEISKMLKSSKFTNDKNVNDILSATERYFVFYIPYVGIVGCGAIHPVRGEIKSVFVKKQYRGLGIAKRLIKFLEDYAKNELKLIRVSMRVKPDNEIMISLAKKLGYNCRYIHFEKVI